MSRSRVFLVAGFLLILCDDNANGQTSTTGKEFWPKLTATIELGQKTNIQLWVKSKTAKTLTLTR